MMNGTTQSNSADTAANAVAVIGMNGRFPGAPNLDAFWQNLVDGVESIRDFTDAELIAGGIDPSYFAMPGFVRRGSVLDDVERFDASFFGYSARDAETIDPQQRVFLEVIWEALENAGCDPDRFDGQIGVFAGSDQSSYIYQIYNSVDMSSFGYGGMMAIGNEKDYLTTQVSYKLNLRGPSVNVQTSCSTSLVAVVTALQNLVHGYCDVAVAGGVAIAIPQRKGYWYQPGGIVSPDGHCRAFDVQAMGTVIGSGVGVVVLKRLADALRDGDRIEAVLTGFGLNNDGSGKVGYTAPSGEGQARAIRAAQAMAGIHPESIGFIEAHGTATTLGDPVEVAALSRVFREKTAKQGFCAIGSLKTNVGHLSSASGIAGLLKAILAVRAGKVPASLHFQSPNPQLALETSPFFVPAQTIDWPIAGHPRRAGVSSFGVGGTNAHVIVEQAPAAVAAASSTTSLEILTISARTAAALERANIALADHLERHPELAIADVAHTLQTGRKAFEHRRALIVPGADRDAAIAALRGHDWEMAMTARAEAQERSVVFMFSGQGSQYVGMGHGLYQTNRQFRDSIDASAEILHREMGLDLRETLYPAEANEAASARLRRTELAQPALFMVEYALAQLWQARLGPPVAMLGHSIGEYVAACLAGVMSLEDALALVAARGALMGAMPPGAMLAVMLPESAIQHLLSPVVALAAVNGPSLCVLSGPTMAIANLEARLGKENVACTRLHTSHAFHSPMMEGCLPAFIDRLRQTPLAAPTIPMLSNLTGQWMTPELATSPEYWAAHLRMTVRFSDNLREVMTFPDLALIEVGPGHMLQVLAGQQGSRAASQVIVPSLRAPGDDAPDDILMLHSTARLWLGGRQIDWRGLRGDDRRSLLALPTYPFERRRYWLGPSEEEALASDTPHAGPRPASIAVPIGIDGTRVAVEPPPSAQSQPPAGIDGWFYTPQWTEDAAPPATAAIAAGSHWLVLGQGALADAVSAALEAAGAQVTTAAAGKRVAVGPGAKKLVVRPGERRDFDALLAHLAQRDVTPRHIVHLLAAAPPATEDLDAALDTGFFSIIHLGQALAAAAGSAATSVAVITDRLAALRGSSPQHMQGASADAAARAITQEYPHLRFRTIDADAAAGDASAADTAKAVLEEVQRDTPSPLVAVRGSRRWTQDFASTPLPKADAVPLLADGSYVITGGLGNIGLVIAESIARAAKARLVLVSRRALPPPDRWPAEIASGGALAATLSRLQAIAALGAEIEVVTADMTSADDVRALAAKVTAQGAPHAIIHAAAKLDSEGFLPLDRIDRDSAATHFDAKVRGLQHLEAAFADAPPKVWMLMSSISAILGGLNLGAYAAANAMLDGWAAARNRQAAGTDAARWISMDWDAWEFANANARTAITPATGADAFRRLMASGADRMVISVTPLADRLSKWARLATAARTGDNGDAPLGANGAGPVGANGAAPVGANGGATHAYPRPDLSTAFAAPRTARETAVAEVWQHFLGIDRIGIDDKFFELGGHSLLAIQVLARMREVTGVNIPVHKLFEAPTVRGLAAIIDADAGKAPRNAHANIGANANAAKDTPKDVEVDDVMALVEGMSDVEVEALLAELESEEAK